MPIYKLLQEAAFDADDTKIITTAYEAALKLVRLADRHDPLTALLASKIIEVFRNGERNPSRVCARALEELGVGPN